MTRNAFVNGCPGRAPHLAMIRTAVLHQQVVFGLAPQGGQPFQVPQTSCPAITVIGDDTHRADGPGGFHSPSLYTLISNAGLVVLIACEPLPTLYAAAATAAAMHRVNCVIIETREEQEIPWIEFLLAKRPDGPTILGTTTVGRA